MSGNSDYLRLLDATIEHVSELKAQGARYLPVTPATLQSLAGSNTLRNNSVKALARASSAAQPAPSRSAPVAAPTAGSIPVQAAPATPGSIPPATDAKRQAMDELRALALVCQKCAHLVASRKNVVFGVGSPDAELLFVGEAPGADEDTQGEPFVGAAGQLLTRIIQTMGFTRDTVYIANILKCRPDTPGETSGNRKPTPEEMQTCIPWLHAQIDLIRPRVMVALGATAVEGLLGKTVGITRLRGNWQRYRDIPLMPTFHPAYLLRDPSKKKEAWDDLKTVLAALKAMGLSPPDSR